MLGIGEREKGMTTSTAIIQLDISCWPSAADNAMPSGNKGVSY